MCTRLRVHACPSGQHTCNLLKHMDPTTAVALNLKPLARRIVQCLCVQIWLRCAAKPFLSTMRVMERNAYCSSPHYFGMRPIWFLSPQVQLHFKIVQFTAIQKSLSDSIGVVWLSSIEPRKTESCLCEFRWSGCFASSVCAFPSTIRTNVVGFHYNHRFSVSSAVILDVETWQPHPMWLQNFLRSVMGRFLAIVFAFGPNMASPQSIIFSTCVFDHTFEWPTRTQSLKIWSEDSLGNSDHDGHLTSCHQSEEEWSATISPSFLTWRKDLIDLS